MATGFGRGRIYLASFDSMTLKTPCYTQKSPGYLLYKPSYSRFFVPNFVAMATGVIWQQGLVMAVFGWLHSKPPIGRKHLRDISYTSRVIADFVPNFVAIATGDGRGRIWLASSNSPPPKTPCYTQRSRGYLLYKPSYRRFLSQISLPWQRGSSGGKFR